MLITIYYPGRIIIKEVFKSYVQDNFHRFISDVPLLLIIIFVRFSFQFMSNTKELVRNDLENMHHIQL